MNGDTGRVAGSSAADTLPIDRLRRLGTVAAELASATSTSEVIRVAMRTLDAPRGAPSRALWLLAPGAGHLELVAEQGLVPEAAEAFARIAIDSDLPGAIAVRERATVRSPSQDDTIERFPELEGAGRSTDGFVAIPLVVADDCFGVLVFGSDHDVSASELDFLETVAGLLAHALSRIRLADALRDRVERMAALTERERHRREQLEFLADLTVDALAADDHHQLMEAVTRRAVPTLGDWCSLHFVTATDATVEVVVAHADPDRVAWAEDLRNRYPYDPDAPSGVAAVIRSGRAEFIAEVTDSSFDEEIAESSIDPGDARSMLDELQLTSVITVPLATKQGVIGAMQFVSAESGRRYDADDVALAHAVAGRVAETLTNHWLADQHRHISATLQEALLPPQLPNVPGLEVAARYWPAGAVSEVGGDFYDLFAIGDGSWSTLIGDACGTGSNAAALTSIARHTVRAAARHGHDHLEVIGWLNQAILHSDRNLFCTACYATLTHHADRSTWQLVSATAGHPLPAFRPSEGSARLLGRPGTLLGVFDEVRAHTETTTLRNGDVVVLYTDGVTDLPPPADLSAEQFLAFLDDLPAGLTAGGIADAIRRSVVERVPDEHRRDDIAVLVIRVADE